MTYASIDTTIMQKLNMKEMSVYLALKTFRNNNTNTAHPSIAILSEILKCCQNTVRKYLRSLEQKGIIAIQERPRYKDGKKYHDTNLYRFLLEGVLQKNNKSTSKKADELSKKEMSVVVDIESIKKELIEKYNKDILNQALQALKRATKKGTIVNNLKAYLNTICVNIQAQMQLISNIKDTKETQSKIPTLWQSRYQGKNSFHNFEQRTSKYSKEELEKMFRRNS